MTVVHFPVWTISFSQINNSTLLAPCLSYGCLCVTHTKTRCCGSTKLILLFIQQGFSWLRCSSHYKCSQSGRRRVQSLSLSFCQNHLAICDRSACFLSSKRLPFPCGWQATWKALRKILRKIKERKSPVMARWALAAV